MCILTKAFGKRPLTKRIFDLHNNSIFLYRYGYIDIFLSIFPKIGLPSAPDIGRRFAKGRTFEDLQKISLFRKFYLEKVRTDRKLRFPETPTGRRFAKGPPLEGLQTNRGSGNFFLEKPAGSGVSHFPENYLIWVSNLALTQLAPSPIDRRFF